MPSDVVAGTISGRIVFRGEVPAPPVVEILKDREACGVSVASEALVVAPENRGVKYAVVSVEGVSGVPETGPREVALENRGCRFVPHVLALRVGSELVVTNADPVLHNLRAWAEGHRHVLNVVQPTQGQVTRRTIKRSGVIELSCDTHVHMAGWLVAFDHPFFAISGDDGAFRIDGVPPGTYRVIAWHEGWTVVRREPNGRVHYDAPRILTREVTVPDAGTVRVTFEFSSVP